MYSKYQYVSGATQANILADLTAILTGETTVANLSSSCDKPNSTILSTIASGWTLHDGSSGTNKKVIKAPYSGNANIYKYVELNTSLGTNYFVTHIYETFNGSTHIGTNKSGNGDYEYYQRMDTTTANNKFHLFASARFIDIFAEMANGTFGDASYSGSTLISEFKPLCPWNDDTNYPYPAFCVGFSESLSNYKKTYLPRAKSNTNSDLTGTSAVCTLASIGANAGYIQSASFFPSGANAKVYDGNGNLKVPRFPIFIVNPEVFTMPVGDVSASANVWLAPSNLLARFDIVTIGSDEFVAMPAFQSSVMFLIRKG